MATLQSVRATICRHASRTFPQTPSILSTCRTFYTYKVPTDTPRTELDDGSILIHKKKPEVKITDEAFLPPKLHDWNFKPPRLTKEQIAEARRLREEDPDRWTIPELAKQFGTVSQILRLFVGTPKERAEFVNRKHQERFDRLPYKRKIALVDRQRRKHLW